MGDLQNLVQRAFAGGEISQSMGARADLARYTQALRTCRNFDVRRSGGVSNRAGFQFIADTKTGGSKPVYFLKWVFTAAEQSTLIEAGDAYFRFYQEGVRLTVTIAGLAAYAGGTTYAQGDLVKDGGIAYYALRTTVGDTPASSASDWYPLPVDPSDATQAIYEIPTPYDADAFNSPTPLRGEQDGAELTITHTSYATLVLKNNNILGVGDPDWTLEPITTSPTQGPPTAMTATAGAAGTLAPVYVVTAVAAETYEESIASNTDPASTSAAPTEALPNALAWTAPAAGTVLEYRVYKDPVANGTFGFIGTATGQVTFKDYGQIPDFNRRPPVARTLFAASNDYPFVCAYYQQRRIFAHTANQPWTFWTSRTGHVNNFSARSPLQDDDPVTATLRTGNFPVIRHLIALKRLVILTEGGELVARGDENGALVPAAINIDQHGGNGACNVPPSVVGNHVIYVQARGSLVRVAKFTEEIEVSLTTGDLTVMAGHLFEDYVIARTAYQQAPNSIVWLVRSDGTLLGLTYLPEDDIFGWHRHDTLNGAFEDVCVVPEDDGDVLYAIVRRTIDGSTVRYIERLAPRPTQFTDATVISSAIFLDCAATKTGVSATAVAGLDHLEGEVVYALADGLAQGPFTVASGAITLTTAAATVHVGKQITADLEFLTLDAQGTGVRDKRKNVRGLALEVLTSRAGFYTGPDTAHLFPYKRESHASQTAVFSGLAETSLASTFNTDGRCVVRHTKPTPLTILAAIPQFEMS